MPLLVDEINRLSVRLSSIKPSYLKQLDEWRLEAHQSLDRFCKRWCREHMDEIRNKSRQELDRLRLLMDQQDVTKELIDSISKSLRTVEAQLTEVEHCRIALLPLPIDDNLVRLRPTNRDILPLRPSHRSIPLKSDWFSPMATNGKILFVCHKSSLCLLDRQLTILKEIPFTHGEIRDICWSSTLDRFLVILMKQIFTFDAKTMTIDSCQLVSKNTWARGTCSNTTLFLLTDNGGSFIGHGAYKNEDGSGTTG
jgi:hypothetical protein